LAHLSVCCMQGPLPAQGHVLVVHSAAHGSQSVGPVRQRHPLLTSCMACGRTRAAPEATMVLSGRQYCQLSPISPPPSVLPTCTPLQVPTDYFVLVLGPHLKYSSCLYNSPRNTIAEAEHNMLGGFPPQQDSRTRTCTDVSTQALLHDTRCSLALHTSTRHLTAAVSPISAFLPSLGVCDLLQLWFTIQQRPGSTAHFCPTLRLILPAQNPPCLPARPPPPPPSPRPFPQP
jgi:hypothetical protein